MLPCPNFRRFSSRWVERNYLVSHMADSEANRSLQAALMRVSSSYLESPQGLSVFGLITTYTQQAQYENVYTELLVRRFQLT